MSMKSGTFVLAAGTALLLALTACGDDNTASSESSSDQTFTGAPVTVMTIAPVDTAAINQPEIHESAKAAVATINAAGGLGGHEVKLITCNDGNDTNKAADCARRAVSEKAVAVLGGFTTNGATINPILEDAGIPWIGAPGFSANELGDKNSYLLLAGGTSFAGIAAKAVKDGCSTISTVQYDSPATGHSTDLINLGIRNAGGQPANVIKVPTTTTDFTSVAKSAGESDCAILGLPNDQVVAVAKAGESVGVDTRYYPLTGALNETVLSQAGEAMAGATSASNFVVASDPAWDAAKSASDDVDWTGVYNQDTWASYQVLADVMQGHTDITAATVTQAMEGAKDIDAGGLMAPVDFTVEFTAPELNRVFNRNVVYTTVEDGKIVQDGGFEDLSPLFVQ
ncbi:ABC transporter substrate-binding protein [Gordonia rubripertincta]|uniref:ABC transporter substrate-binding protein n=1 Tax=Gordonia rubripertincta TaxID=36822 RepID=A0ABT4MNC9_GORRU|nr:ABC transporter substrate-binding protein [Gordonia rubripertincta]MCZ4548498.1 ABC transporter substrate-binding protein [Gordonia rubripertincta]